jgi:hypothetical protein
MWPDEIKLRQAGTQGFDNNKISHGGGPRIAAHKPEIRQNSFIAVQIAPLASRLCRTDRC